MDEGLNFSDIFDDDIPYEQKPPEMLRPMEENDFPIQTKNLFAGLWENEKLSESDQLHFGGIDYSYDDSHAFCVFIIYPTFSVWYLRNKNGATFFSDNVSLNKLIQRFNGGHSRIHHTIRSILHQISEIPDSPIPKGRYQREETSSEIISGRMWNIKNKIYISFWQSKSKVKPYWNKVEHLIKNVGLDSKTTQYLFSGVTTEDGLNSYEEVIKGLNIGSSINNVELELRKKLHTNPQIKKSLLNLPPNRLEFYADKMKIPLIKLKQILGSMDETSAR